MSGSIAFSTIPQNTRVPLFHIEFDSTKAGAALSNPRTLVVGDSSNALSIGPSFVPSAAWAANTFGRHSMLADMVRAALENDPIGELWAAPVATTGTSATGTIVASGTATESGQIVLYVGGARIPVDIASGDDSTAVASKISAAGIAYAAANPLPVTFSAAASSTVTLTARHAGTIQNTLDVRHSYRGPAGGEALPAGVALAITAVGSVVAGTGAPDLAGLAAALNDQEWDYVIVPYTDSTSLAAIAALMSFTAGRWSDASQSYGHVWSAKVDTAANLVTFGAARNDPHLTVFGLAGSPSPVWRIAAAAGAAAAQALKANPSRPVQALDVAGVLAPLEADRFSRANRQSLLTNGIATLLPQRDGTITIERAVTTYQTNRYGQPDTAYLDAHRMYQLMAVTRRLKQFVTQNYPRHILADDGTRVGAGSAVVTPRSIKAALVAQYDTMEREGLVQNAQEFARATVVERDPIDRTRVNVLYAPQLTSGLSVFAVLNQFRT